MTSSRRVLNVLRRLARDLQDAQDLQATHAIPMLEQEESCALASATSKIKVETSVYLEDLEFRDVQVRSEAEDWANWLAERLFPNDAEWQTLLIERFCVVHDDVFSFLIETATEVTARIKLKEGAKTVQDGGLWYEEALPTETILCGVVLAMPIAVATISVERTFAILQDLTREKTLQFGGKATVGRGLCRVILTHDTQEEN